MRGWKSAIKRSNLPKYAALFEVLREEIESGRLEAGHRLPTHRSLASDLDVTVGVVVRAYQLLEQKQLIMGQVGRGTFVRARGGESQHALFDFTQNSPPVGGISETLVAKLKKALDSDIAIQYAHPFGSGDQRAVFAEHARKSGLDAHAENTLVTTGGMGAITSAIVATCRDANVIVENYTFSKSLGLLTTQARFVIPVSCDADGVDVAALKKAIHASKATACFFTPTLHNPLLFTASNERRLAIAEVLNENGVLLIEDDVYRDLSQEGSPPPLSTYVDNFLYLSSFSKSMWPSARVGFCVCSNAEIANMMKHSLSITQVMPNLLQADVISELISTGQAKNLFATVRQEIKRRNEYVRTKLSQFEIMTSDYALHFNMAGLINEQAQSPQILTVAENVQVVPLSLFRCGPEKGVYDLHARVSIGGLYNFDVFSEGISKLAQNHNTSDIYSRTVI